MIDTRNPCSRNSNWKASNDSRGGRPGQKNSVDGINNDDTAPKLLRAFAANSTTITLVFDEPLDSLKAVTISNYAIDNGIYPVSATGISPVFDEVNINVSPPVNLGTVYTITSNNLTDCRGNLIGSKNMTRFGLSQEADSFDIVFNEILFNPKPLGTDYVELYNRSQRIIDLSHIYLANRNSSNIVSSIQQVATESILLFQGDLAVLTSDLAAVKLQYIQTNPEAFVTLKKMPSNPDDKEKVLESKEPRLKFK